MPPPRIETHDVDSTAPLSKWEVGMAFDNLQECNQAKYALIKKIDRVTADPKMSNEERHFLFGKSSLAQCISTDDPRLKEH